MVYQNLLQVIGNTPLVKLNLDVQASIYAKLEYLNPGGSIKDRTALYMIDQAERKGLLKPGGTIIEASSGNQGIATAMIGAIKGYNVIITITNKASEEKIKAIKAYGAKVISYPSTQFLDDPESYHSHALKIHKKISNSFMINQYYNMSNSLAHYNLLAKEIWNQTEGKITHFFAGAGSCGTISGIGKYLKEKNPDIKIIAVDSINSYHATKGNPKPYKIDGLGIDFDSPLLDYSVIDEFIEVADEDVFDYLKILSKKHGFLVGPTSGAVAYSVKKYSYKFKSNDFVVMIFGDSGRAYLSKGYHDEVYKENFASVKESKISKNLEL